MNNCLLADRSLLWPNLNLWTPEIVAALKHAIYNTPMVGTDLSYEQKLLEQMKDAPREGWGVLADIYYIYYLPALPSSIKFETKRKFVSFAAEQGGYSVPGETDEIWQPLRGGFCAIGQRYNLKYLQTWAVLLFADDVKQSANRQEILNNPHIFQATMDKVLGTIPDKGDRAVDMRHAMLYLAFPDQYEPIISTQDKKVLLKAFSNQVSGPLPKDQDAAILKIRQALSKEKDLNGEPFSFYQSDLITLWKDLPPDSSMETKEKKPATAIDPEPMPLVTFPAVLQAKRILQFTRNMILYGPPGTGKTFLARKIAEELVCQAGPKVAPDEIRLEKIAESLTFYDVMALGIYLAGAEKSFSANDVLQLPLVQARFRVRPVKTPYEMVWGTLQNHADRGSKTVKVRLKFGPALFDKGSDSRWKLTLAGKDYVVQNLKDALHDLQAKPSTAIQPDDFIFSVTFHQSYSYEDFIEGIRPTSSSEENDALAYEVTPGIFRRICARAAANPENKFVLLIDEINRGNIAKVFGELITLIEDDKRKGEKNALKSTLPYSGDDLTVPGNLYLIGTMNTADRSIALLDVALRRRFAFQEVMPDHSLFANSEVVYEEGISLDLGDLLSRLNARIVKDLDRNHQIGHSYFWKVSQAPQEQRLAVLEFVWNYQVLPLLEEYFHSQRARLVEILKPFVPGLSDDVDLETIEIPRVTGEDLLTALKEISA